MSTDWTPERVAACRPEELRVVEEWPLVGGKYEQAHVVEADTVEALIQAVGYLKYTRDGAVFFRGQTKQYGPGCPVPQASRPEKATSKQEIYRTLMLGAEWEDFSDDEILLSARKPRGSNNLLAGGIPLYVAEPLLQHYGLTTRWLDITDSLPYAMLFGLMDYSELHRPSPPRPSGRFRSPLQSDEPRSAVMRNVAVLPVDRAGYSYLYAIMPGRVDWATSAEFDRLGLRGLWAYEKAHLIDMRVAAPSIFLRPHAQHGLLVKPHANQVSL